MGQISAKLLQLFLIFCHSVPSITLLAINSQKLSKTNVEADAHFELDQTIHISMPQVHPDENDQYLCTSGQLNTTETLYIGEIQINFSPGRAHHYLLYGCYEISHELLQRGYWPCNIRGKGNNCSGRKQIPIGFKKYNDPDSNTTIFKYPFGVGYTVGPKYKINYIVLEIHYLKALPKGITDSSGVTFLASKKQPLFLCGSLTFARVGFQIPPHREKFSIDMSCKISSSHSIYPYSSWVHTHDLGSVVSAYVIHPNNPNNKNRSSILSVKELTRWTHHWPQPLALNSKEAIINPGDIVAAKCTYNSSGQTQIVSWGSKRSDEMCNLFLSFYTARDSLSEDLAISCVNELSREITRMLPKNADTLPSRKPSGEKKEDIICRIYRKFNMPCSLV